MRNIQIVRVGITSQCVITGQPVNPHNSLVVCKSYDTNTLPIGSYHLSLFSGIDCHNPVTSPPAEEIASLRHALEQAKKEEQHHEESSELRDQNEQAMLQVIEDIVENLGALVQDKKLSLKAYKEVQAIIDSSLVDI